MAAQGPDPAEREIQIAKVLRPLGIGPLSLSHAKAAAKLLRVSWSTVYRLRKRFLADPVASSLRPQLPGPTTGSRRLALSAERIVDIVLTQWLPRQRQLAHPLRDRDDGGATPLQAFWHQTRLESDGCTPLASIADTASARPGQ